MNSTIQLNTAEDCVDSVINKVGRSLTVALPLGLGKPLHFINALYQRAKDDDSIELHIVTALSLLAPSGGSSLERRFMEPFAQRLYGDIPELAYARDLAADKLPGYVRVSELFFQAGSFLNHSTQQRNYVCTNYTHAVRDLLATGINVIGQLVSAPETYRDDDCVSLSCNPDLSLDIIPLLRKKQSNENPVAIVAETNSALPFFGNHAAVPVDTFDIMLDVPDGDYPLFSAPQTPVSPQEHMIGFYASTLLRDGGTLQVGIGSLGTAVIQSILLRHQHNEDWQRLYRHLTVADEFPVAGECGGTAPFHEGLYGCSEMMVDGFIYLMEAGVLTREVRDQDGTPVVMHGGFYLGPARFYDKLRELAPEEKQKICMTSVNFINDLYDHRFGDQQLKREQRVHGRFINTAMMQTLDGAAISDGLEDGRVVSGVGGQYNFVAMAHELPDARSILVLNSTRQSGSEVVSNIVFSYGHCTIPRHLRDIVITEYGIADLRGRSDEQVYLALIRISDSRFQSDLLQQAKAAGKVPETFALPQSWQNNRPEKIEQAFRDTATEDLFETFPFGHDFTEDELLIGKALKALKADTATKGGILMTVLRALTATASSADHTRLLARMALDRPTSWKERLDRQLLLHGLRKVA